MIKLVNLTVDASVSTKLFAKQKMKLTTHLNVIKLDQCNNILTERIYKARYRNVKNAQGTTLFQKKKKAKARLNSIKKRLRVKMIAQTRKRHFRTVDTQIFDAQFVVARVSSTFTRDIQHDKSIIYNILERVKIVRLICSLDENLSDREKFQRRIQVIETRTTLCNRREAQRRDRLKAIMKQKNSNGAMNDFDESFKEFFTICRPTQCLFCLGNESLLYHHRVYEYAKPHQMMNEVERHLKRFAPTNEVPCPHPQCKTTGLILLRVMAFKNHTATVHKVFLRA